MRQHASIWLRALIGISLIALITYFGLDLYSQQYLLTHIHRPSDFSVGDYSNAGQYLNFVIGIPLAISAALIGAFVSFQVGQYTNMRDDFSTLDFVEKVSAPLFEAQSRIAAALNSLISTGRVIFNDVEQEINTTLPSDDPDDFHLRVQDIHERLATTQSENLNAIKVALDTVALQYAKLASRMHSAMFLKEHLLHIQSRLPIAYLAEVLPESASQECTGATLRGMADGLLWLQARTTSFDLTRAYFYLPQSFAPIDFIGMALFSPIYRLASPQRLPNGQIVTSYAINIGAAYLASLYESLPDKSDIYKSLKRLMKIPPLAANYLDRAGPSMSDMANPQHDKMLRRIVENPHTLIVLQTEDDALFYDPALHGKIAEWELAGDGR